MPPKTFDASLQGEFIGLGDFLPSLGTSYTTAQSELEPYLENNNTIHYRPRKHNRNAIKFDTWSEALTEYEMFTVKSLGPEAHESMLNCRSFMFEANKKYDLYAINIYDIKHKCKLASNQTISQCICFSLPDQALLLTILNTTAVKPNAPRCP